MKLPIPSVKAPPRRPASPASGSPVHACKQPVDCDARQRAFIIRLAWVSLLTFLVGAPQLAGAHGVFPQSDNVRLPSPSSPLPVVITTFGFLNARSAQDWTWVCEDVTGDSLNASLDLPFEVLEDQTWLLGTLSGMWYSADHCQWAQSEGIGSLYVSQVKRDQVDSSVIWATTTTGGSDITNALWRSTDGGRSFEVGVTFGSTSTLRGFMQGQDGGPFYVIGWREGTPRLWSASEPSSDPSDWTEYPLPFSAGELYYPLEIDYHRPEVVWLRYIGLNEAGNPEERLMRFEEGETEVLFRSEFSLDGFASGPAEGELYVGGRQGGLFSSKDGGKSWEGPNYAPEVGCLKTFGNRRFQCTNNLADGVAVTETDLKTGQTKDVVWFGDVHGPETCDPGTQSAQICDPYWESIKATAFLDQSEVESPTPSPDDVQAGGCGCGEAEAPTASPSSAWLPLLFPALIVWRVRRLTRGPQAPHPGIQKELT